MSSVIALSAVILPIHSNTASLKSAFTLSLNHRYFCKNSNTSLRTPILRRANEFRIYKVCKAANTAVERETGNVVKKDAPILPFRVGHGFDLHRLEPGLPLIIGGISIPHDRGCDAHSDGDVLFHCVVDAILGALGLPDIGQLFPDSDPKWRGADSSVFLKEAVRLMHEAGYDLGNLDATLILQRPKAKTHEKVDSLGENRSIAAHTVVLLMKK